MTVVWFVIFLVLLFIEIITINLVSIWFSIGALFAMITTFFTDLVQVQMLVFFVVSLLCLIMTKPVVNKLRKRKVQATNLDRVIGMSGVVTSPILPNEVGEVKVDGKRWSAISSDGVISDGEMVNIVRIDGVKLIVEKKEN